MNNLKIFNYEGNEIRTVNKESETWWVVKDICTALDIRNSRDVATRLDSSDRAVDLIDTRGGKQEMSIVNESGLYNIILLSRKPEAIKFKRWVTGEVLPSIRKHGLYAAEELLANPDLWIKALQELKAERSNNEELKSALLIQQQQIAEMKPKASYYDVVLGCSDAITVSAIAKDYGRSGRWLNEYLNRQRVQYRQEEIWLLYQKYACFGYTVTQTHCYPDAFGRMHAKMHTYWTQKGRLFIYEMLKANGILPLIEDDQQTIAM